MDYIIIEESHIDREKLKKMLRPYVNFQFLAEAVNTNDAFNKILHLKPDLLFLNAELDGKSAFQLLTRFTKIPKVIFTASSTEQAHSAFEFGGLDYLLKPISEERLHESLEKYAHIERPVNRKAKSAILKLEDQIIVEHKGNYDLVQLKQVVIFEFDEAQSIVKYDNRSASFNKNLTVLEDRLDNNSFFRANRHQIINLSKVADLEPQENGQFVIVLKNGQRIQTSREQSRLFDQL